MEKCQLNLSYCAFEFNVEESFRRILCNFDALPCTAVHVESWKRSITSSGFDFSIRAVRFSIPASAGDEKNYVVSGANRCNFKVYQAVRQPPDTKSEEREFSPASSPV